jgi:hypothetical protein
VQQKVVNRKIAPAGYRDAISPRYPSPTGLQFCTSLTP